MHWARRAASRADWTAGRSSAIRTAMMAITTRSSISVNPRRLSECINVSNHPKKHIERRILRGKRLPELKQFKDV